MFITLSLLLFCASIDAFTLTHEFVENDLISGCRFDLGEQAYDLCPLLLQKTVIEVRGVTRMLESHEWSQRLYSFVFGGALDNQQCPEGTWICMKETRGSDHDAQSRTAHTPIAGKLRPGSSLVDQGTNAVASVYNDVDSPSPTPLNLFLNGGFQDNKARYARIEFICDPNTESTRPSFSGERLGVHSFIWSTKHGCPTSNLNASPDLHILENENADNSEPPPNDSEEEQELLDPNFPRPMSRRWLAFILLTASATVILLSILIVSPHARFIVLSHLKAVSSTLKLTSQHISSLSFLPHALQFRAGEDRLVRWAQEDMTLGLIDGGRGGEVDVMVNGGVDIGDEDWNAEGLNEYIPLKYGALKSSKNYGSSHGRQFW